MDVCVDIVLRIADFGPTSGRARRGVRRVKESPVDAVLPDAVDVYEPSDVRGVMVTEDLVEDGVTDLARGSRRGIGGLIRISPFLALVVSIPLN